MVTVNETTVQIFGVDDGQGGKAKQLWQIANAGSKRKDDVFSILAIHVPNGVESYLHYGFDLMLSGHTHGGQIIIPYILNGLYAPGQGFFPKYGGGRYDFGQQTLIISRGLAQKPLWLPRLGNPPELTIVTLKPVS
jgi:predicted MPP superfamily phosphohydrolase